MFYWKHTRCFYFQTRSYCYISRNHLTWVVKASIGGIVQKDEKLLQSHSKRV